MWILSFISKTEIFLKYLLDYNYADKTGTFFHCSWPALHLYESSCGSQSAARSERPCRSGGRWRAAPPYASWCGPVGRTPWWSPGSARREVVDVRGIKPRALNILYASLGSHTGTLTKSRKGTIIKSQVKIKVPVHFITRISFGFFESRST